MQWFNELHNLSHLGLFQCAYLYVTIFYEHYVACSFIFSIILDRMYYCLKQEYKQPQWPTWYADVRTISRLRSFVCISWSWHWLIKLIKVDVASCMRLTYLTSEKFVIYWCVFAEYTNPRVTLVSSSTASCHSHLTSPRYDGFYHLRLLRPVARSLSTEVTKTLVHALIPSRLYYCNSLLFGVSVGLLQKVQSVQNAVLRLLTGARRRDHITPVLSQLHWLPVRRQVEFKVACLMHQTLSGQTPAYLSVDI